jgi:hypothetical protein
VLKAYFDDSGTHAGSDVIVMGGLIAAEEKWAEMQPKWQAGLDYYGIKAMHMSHCFNGYNEFKLWSSDQKEDCIAYFRKLIVETEGYMLAQQFLKKYGKA